MSNLNAATLHGEIILGGGGVTDYNELSNKPSINSVPLIGNKTTGELNISYNDIIDKPYINNMPDASNANIGDVLTKEVSGVGWYPPIDQVRANVTGSGDPLTSLEVKGVLYNIPSGKVNYSTNEQEIGTWLNGEKLYQKTFDLTQVTFMDLQWNDNILGTYNTNINIIDFEGYFTLQNAGNTKFPYYYFRSTTEYFTAIINNSKDISVRPNMNAGVIYGGFVTIKYIKTEV